ncbi:MAG: hypothetical protein WBP64_10055 [Nitrososphaeraceae archaeon]
MIQELYDQVGGTLFFMLEYAKKNDIPLPNRDALFQMADRIHKQMDEIESSRSDENLHNDKDSENRRRFDSIQTSLTYGLTKKQR